VYKRWVAFGMLSTHSRLHGSTSYRVPWLFDDEANDVVRFFTKLKCRLMPYIFAEAVDATLTGVPVMRPMILEFPDDMASNYLDMQYMLGGRVLVAPIFNEEGRADYYLPKGQWIHMLSGEVREGGRYYSETYDYFSLPLYVRKHTLLAFGARDDRPDYDYEKNIDLHIYDLEENKKASCNIVNVEGKVLGSISARLENQVVYVKADSGISLQSVKLHGMDGVELKSVYK
jgi:alpha-D-xyloside xylohydrolase